MKRLLALMMIILIGLLSACAGADMDPHEEPQAISFSDSLRFSWDTMTYTNLSEYDILFTTGRPEEDYFIAREKANADALTVSQEEAYNKTIDNLVLAEATTSLQFTDLGEYSSAEFADYMEDAGVELTPTELFTFYSLQEETISNDYEWSSISKQLYVETRLDRNLTPDEVTAMELLQHYYIELIAINNSSYRLYSDTFEELITDLETWIGFEPTEEEEAQLQVAYDIIQVLLSPT